MILRRIVLSLMLLSLVSGCRQSIPYQDIHRKAIVADLHCDTALRLRHGFDLAKRDTTGDVDLPRLRQGGVDLQVFACWIPTSTPKDKCRSEVDRLIDSLDAQIARNHDQIAICRTAVEAQRIVDHHRIAAFLGIENGVAINDSLENLQHFYDRGIRYMTLTHTASNDWCISSADTAPAFHGLTDFGRQVVREMNRLGMIVDVSHASPATVEEVLKITTKPIIASHSCVYALCPSDRNLTDDQIRAIAKNGGVIGVNFFTGYLSADVKRVSDSMYRANKREVDSIRTLYKDDPTARYKALAPLDSAEMRETAKYPVTVATLVDHIDYIVKLVGPDYVGLGSDFDGIPSLPSGLDDCSKLPNVTKELVRRGYSDLDIAKILGGNFMRVFRQVCGS